MPLSGPTAFVRSGTAPSGIGGCSFVLGLFASGLAAPRWLSSGVFGFLFFVFCFQRSPITLKRRNGGNFTGFFFRFGPGSFQQATERHRLLPSSKLQCRRTRRDFIHERFGLKFR